MLSDIHGNLSALDAVLSDAVRFSPDAAALLGDSIDYGMRSNEVVARLASLDLPVACSVWGNHEDAALGGGLSRFSSERGRQSARATAARLSAASREWLEAQPGRSGMQGFAFAGARFLAVHGSLADPLWGTIAPGSASVGDYAGYDVVLSGHSHVPHAFSLFHDVGDPAMRGRRRVAFVNPGSVGQPRDCDSRASYAVWDSERGVALTRVAYPIEEEQALFDGSVDDFYRARLALGV